MFTQCPKCETVFRLSAESLRAAGGQVRCGRCGEVFNALARLAEDASELSTGESSYEMETRAEEILRSPLESTPAANDGEVDAEVPPGVEVAQLQFIDHLDEDLSAETSLEFTLPPDDLDRVFIESRPGNLQPLAADDYSTSNVVALSSAAQSTASTPPDTSIDVAPDAAPQEQPTPAPLAPIGMARATRQPTRVPGLEVSEAVRREILSSHTYAEPSEVDRPRNTSWFVAWLTAAIILALLLAFQIVHSNRNWLASHVPYLSDKSVDFTPYQLRQWGVSGEPGAKGTLRMRASIMNSAPQLQPYPLLRVTLANRFGARLGTRDFEPAEYLGKATARMLGPGERADALLDILDPGKDAEGFEIDVCLRDTEKKVVCAADGTTAGTAGSLQ